MPRKKVKLTSKNDSENTDAVTQDTLKASSKESMRILRPRTVGNESGEKKRESEEPVHKKPTKKLRSKGVVDAEIELKQLEDPPVTPEEKRACASRLRFLFFDVPGEELAQNLLGKILVRKLDDGTVLKGKIVETEAYLGGEDKASASYNNKMTPGNAPTFMPPGTIFIYLTYGMYHCFSISSKGEGSVAFIRALEPIEGTEQMAAFRNAKMKKYAKTFKQHELSSGPSKFCMAFGLTRDHNKHSVCTWKGLWIEDNPEKQDIKIVHCPRIGIDRAGPEWALKPMRYYIFGEKSVSKIDQKAEAALAQ